MSKLSRAETPAEKVANGEFILQVAERIIQNKIIKPISFIKYKMWNVRKAEF